MLRDTAQDDELGILPLDIGLEDDEDAPGTKDDQDSVARAISHTEGVICFLSQQGLPRDDTKHEDVEANYPQRHAGTGRGRE